MKTRHIELPLALPRTANLDERNLPGEVAGLLALELHRENKILLKRAAELCMDLAPKRSVPPLRYSCEDLERGRRSTDRLEA